MVHVSSQYIGCMNTNAFNFDPLANINDGSCMPVIYGCTDALANNYNPIANTDNESCIQSLYGCTNPNAYNYNPEANIPDGSCLPVINGCIMKLRHYITHLQILTMVHVMMWSMVVFIISSL